MAVMVSARRRLERDVRAALERSELELFYQPRVDLPRTRKVAVEALMRWRRPGHGMLLPESFLDVADDVGLGLKLDRWAIDRACRQAVRWRQAGLVAKSAVNLAAGQANEPQLAGELERILEQTGLEPCSLELELSERSIIDAGGRRMQALDRAVGADPGRERALVHALGRDPGVAVVIAEREVAARGRGPRRRRYGP